MAPTELTPRHRLLLKAVVDAYTKTCDPVASKTVVRRGGFGLSAATIRNDMAELESAGMLFAPHTSAGRVPTEAGYQYYVDHGLGEYRLTARERQMLQPPNEAGDFRQQVKTLAKLLAEASDSCAVVGFTAHDVYYTGLANLFAQPEFLNHQFSCTITAVIDHLDDAMAQVHPQFAGRSAVQILIGRNNPFGRACSALLVGYDSPESTPGVLGLLGPLRMDYPRNRALLAYVQPLPGRSQPV